MLATLGQTVNLYRATHVVDWKGWDEHELALLARQWPHSLQTPPWPWLRSGENGFQFHMAPWLAADMIVEAYFSDDVPMARAICHSINQEKSFL